MGADSSRSRHERIVTRIFFVLIAMPLLCVFPYFRWMNNPNEHTRTFLSMSLVESGRFDITTQIERYGTTGDLAARPDERTGAQRFYGVKAPLTSFLGVPVYALFRVVAPKLGLVPPERATRAEEHALWLERATLALRLFCVQLPCLAFLLFFERFLRRRSSDLSTRLAAVAALGLGSNFLAYANMFASHALFACAAFVSFAITTMERERTDDPRARRPALAFLAALFASACTLLEYHAGGVSMMLGLYAVLSFRRPKSFALCVLAAALCAAALLFYQWKSFGHPLATGHKLQLNAAFVAAHQQGINGVASPDLQALAAIAFDPGFGAFTTSPFLALGLLAFPVGLCWLPRRVEARARERVTLGVLLATMLGLFLLVSGIDNWRGGWSIGPRYLGAVPPFFVLAALCSAEHFAGGAPLRRDLVRAVFLGLAAASLLATGMVSLLVNTLPEELTRPFTQFALPMWRAGFTPHHLGELVGIDASWPFYVVSFSGVASLWLVAGEALLTGSATRYLVWPLAALCAFVALVPVRSVPSNPDEDGVARALALFARRWEPSGRDRIALLRAEMEQGGRDACAYLELAALERSVGLVREAQRSTRSARACSEAP